ncbi:hypothetical protein ACFC08_29605 [Streptomyces sp. NPDC056112]|uniref:hypothetical protein n=1 Tax=Streptomyces sp. NPDC056112 TaxID=3345715 RepID=UPI0035DBA327
MNTAVIPEGLALHPVELIAEPTLGTRELPRLADRLRLSEIHADRPADLRPALEADALSYLDDMAAHGADFFVVRVGCSLIPSEEKDEEPFETLKIFFNLTSPGAPFQPTAWELAPVTTTKPVMYTPWATTYSFSKFGAKLEAKKNATERQVDSATVQANGTSTQRPRWDFYTRPVQSLGGDQRIEMLVRAPIGHPVIAEVRASATVKIRKFGRREMIARVPEQVSRVDLHAAPSWISLVPTSAPAPTPSS